MPDRLDVEALSGPSSSDHSAPNGSSIAFIAEFGGRRVLLAAGAHPDLLEAQMAENLNDRGVCPIHLFKLSHHGSRANLTSEMLKLIDCKRFAISSSGARFGHPDPEAIARLLKFGANGPKFLYFNYSSDRTTPWDNEALRAQWNYKCIFPGDPNGFLEIDI